MKTQIPQDKTIELVDEVPLGININGVNHAVMMASPYDLNDFAMGFLFCEHIINDPSDIKDVEINETEDCVQIEILLTNRCNENYKQKVRYLKGPTGCGLCGKAAMEEAFPKLAVLTRAPLPNLIELKNVRSKLSDWQMKAKQSGGLHAAFLLDNEANIIDCKEDIGRHNAMDKLIGAALRKGLELKHKTILITSRCSVELVQKAITVGCGNLATLSAPSSLSVNFAQSHNLNLLQMRRVDDPIVY